VYEASPLNRVVTQYGPGNAWQSSYHGIETQYLTNTQSAPYNCKRYSAGSADTPTENGTYAPAQLYVNETTDEDGHVSYTFTDKLRQVLLTRQMDGTTAHDTYYVYDDRGNLRFVLPPKYQDAPNTTGLAQYAYQYKYDHRKRMIAKKLPGAEWIYYIYDKDDRLIFTQDGVQRAKSTPEWTFSISDAFGRTVLTGTCTHSLSYTSNPLGNTGVYANYSGTSASTMGYTVSGVTLTNAKVFTANYYDTYSFRSLSGFSNSHLAYNTSAGTDYQTRYGVDSSTYHHKGKLTGTAVALLDDATTPTYLYTAMYYDDRGRVIQTNATNQFSGGYEKEYIAYNFVGQPVKRKHVHYKGSGSTQTEDYAYTYDQAGRLLTTKHKLNGGSEQTLVDNGYDDLGRLTQNSRNGDAELMSNYTYNIRSWLKTITGILFSDTLYYNDTYAGSTARYNGNIGAMSWRAGSSSATLRGYTFSYDNLSRLTAAAYKEGEAASSKYGTSYAYDKNGNMTSLQRYGHTNTSSYDLIDDLTITYTGNQLKKVEDAAAVPSISLGYEADFRDRSNTNTTTEYTFDANGNLKTDLNKGISSNITYNSLNLPRTLKFGNTSNPPTNTYTYTADGRLVTVVRESATTQYAGNMIYEGTTLKRILVDGGYIEGSTYYYYLTDHLGNNRVVANASGTVQQINHYYPYGMTFDDSTEPTKQPYKYGGKEFDKERSLNWSDFEARQYMNDVPMFTTMDPLAEKYYSYSPYAYCAGNPVRFIDPDGKKIVIGSWWGRFMAFLGVNNYEAKVQQQIEQLKKDDTVVKGMIERLENSPHIVTINPIPPNRNPDLNLGDGNVTLPRKKDRTRPQGSSIEYNPDNNKTNNGNNRPAKVGLTHEFGHADDLAHGRGINVKGEDGKIDSQKVLEAEKYPIEMENRIRKVLKIEERKAEEYETR
jgi:RHS repeat-associated protein